MRPAHLPDFDDPPLTEVVVGVQFTPPATLSVTDFSDVRKLFMSTLPQYEEKPPLEPQFETFGGFPIEARPRIEFSNVPLYPRIWLSSDNGDHLIQFQRDRLLLNWRKRNQDAGYPHFEGIRETFLQSLKRLCILFTEKHSVEIEFNQVEVSYINIIPVSGYGISKELFNDLNTNEDIETLSLRYTRILKGIDNEPYGRLHTEISTVLIRQNQEKAFRYSLTARGASEVNSIESIGEFLMRAREKIVLDFYERTTSAYHRIWKMK